MVPPAVVISTLLDLGGAARAALLPILIVLNFVGMAFSLYAFYRFKHLLNHRYEFHDVDALVVLIIIGSVAVTTIATAGRAFAHLGPTVLISCLVMLVAATIPLAVLGIIFAVRLLRLPADLHGLLKPYAYMQIVVSVCALTIILAPLTHLLLAVIDILLALIFFREDSEESELEFV
jgi:hypothetical protein